VASRDVTQAAIPAGNGSTSSAVVGADVAHTTPA
jgi:hypothetical protein